MGIAESEAKYRTKATVMAGNYARSMSQFFGQDVSNSTPVRSYAGKITPATAAKWSANLKNSFGLR